MDDCRGSRAEKDITLFTFMKCGIDDVGIKHFPEPDNIGTDIPAAFFAVGDICGVDFYFLVDYLVTFDTLVAVDITVKFQYVLSLRHLVQTIHVLGNQGKIVD